MAKNRQQHRCNLRSEIKFFLQVIHQSSDSDHAGLKYTARNALAGGTKYKLWVKQSSVKQRIAILKLQLLDTYSKYRLYSTEQKTV